MKRILSAIVMAMFVLTNSGTSFALRTEATLEATKSGNTTGIETALQAPAPAAGVVKSEELQIAIVEDNPQALYNNKLCVTKAVDEYVQNGQFDVGTQIHKFLSARKAIEWITENKPHFVLTDLNLGDGLGFEVARAAKDVNPEARIILLSAVQAGEQKVQVSEYLSSGLLSQFVPKDAFLKDIIQAVKDQVEYLVAAAPAAATERKEAAMSGATGAVHKLREAAKTGDENDIQALRDWLESFNKKRIVVVGEKEITAQLKEFIESTYGLSDEDYELTVEPKISDKGLTDKEIRDYKDRLGYDIVIAKAESGQYIFAAMFDRLFKVRTLGTTLNVAMPEIERAMEAYRESV